MYNVELKVNTGEQVAILVLIKRSGKRSSTADVIEAHFTHPSLGAAMRVAAVRVAAIADFSLRIMLKITVRTRMYYLFRLQHLKINIFFTNKLSLI